MKLVQGEGVFCPFVACVSSKPLTCRNLRQTLLCTLMVSLSTDISLPSFSNSRPLLWKGRRGHAKPIFVVSWSQATQSQERKGSLALNGGGCESFQGDGI